MVLPAVWAQREDITKCLSEMRSVPSTDRTGMASVSHKEIRLEMELLHDRPVSESNLINSNRKLEALGNLSQSLVSQLKKKGKKLSGGEANIVGCQLALVHRRFTRLAIGIWRTYLSGR